MSATGCATHVKFIFGVCKWLENHCPVGRNITNLLIGHFITATSAMKTELSSVSLLDLLNELREILPQLQPPWEYVTKDG
ncbi:hypothetical protein SAMN02745215_04431 [Desulfitobacterium chlororespirans DSM 11544]|uniref:Uncharacterized protein n=1 Tax=Desulfitobacterium chlororespirans DSM 11544 TaxID=1121395 RepID=A0A1M7UQZ0_9FIRM|nr:hypothetical protein SAMN02745215_04431 [Desulfitobacterium chlororespirans DSM 11544]